MTERQSSKDNSTSHRRERGSHPTLCRRRTLSPASTKAILEQEIEDAQTATADLMEVEGNDNREPGSEVVSKKRSADSDGSSEDIERSPMKVQVQQARVMTSDSTNMLCDIQCDSVVSDVISHQFEYENINNGQDATDLTSLETASLVHENKNIEERSPPHIVSSHDLVEIKRDQSSASIAKNEEVISASDGDGDGHEEAMAMQRYEMRMEVAKWKYFWEVVSVDAARVARTNNGNV